MGKQNSQSRQWSKEIPTKEGCYFIRAVETEGEEVFINVYENNGFGLCGDFPDLGHGLPILVVHRGLTDPEWSHAISITENQ